MNVRILQGGSPKQLEKAVIKFFAETTVDTATLKLQYQVSSGFSRGGTNYDSSVYTCMITWQESKLKK